ncbi:N-acetylneuraminate synthase family protein [Candidatus Bipolaricaulota bacterium]
MDVSTGTKRGLHSYIIAEMACSHDGDCRLAKKIIDAAGTAGANAIQFQIWILADMVVAHHPSYQALEKLELAPSAWKDLARYTRDRYPDLDIIACVSEQSSIELAEELGADAYKTHAGDLSNHTLLKHVAQTGKRIDLCVGASTQEEISGALEAIRGVADVEIWLMYGYQTFPTPVDAIHMRYMKTLQEKYGLPIGYQDHSDADSEAAFYLPAVAAGLGIGIQEKHVTHDRSAKGADYQSALNPAELKRLVEMLCEIQLALGSDAQREFSQEEEKYRKYSKKSLVAARELAAGQRLGKGDLLAMRADKIGLPPDKFALLQGGTLTRAIAYQHLVTEKDIT